MHDLKGEKGYYYDVFREYYGGFGEYYDVFREYYDVFGGNIMADLGCFWFL